MRHSCSGPPVKTGTATNPRSSVAATTGGRPPGSYVNRWVWANTASIVDNVATCGYIEGMKSVGVRELKNRLSEYLRDVRAGERVLVTDRGEVVAELTPPGQGVHESDVPAALATLARRGLATLGAPGDRSLYPRLARRGRRRLTALQLLDEERGSR
jgi:prevent-host-death family protein